MSPQFWDDEPCRNCERLEKQLDKAEDEIENLKAQLREIMAECREHPAECLCEECSDNGDLRRRD